MIYWKVPYWLNGRWFLQIVGIGNLSMNLHGRWFPQIVVRDSGNPYPMYIKKIMVLASEPVGRRSRVTELLVIITCHRAFSIITLTWLWHDSIILDRSWTYAYKVLSWSTNTPAPSGLCHGKITFPTSGFTCPSQSGFVSCWGLNLNLRYCCVLIVFMIEIKTYPVCVFRVILFIIFTAYSILYCWNYIW